MIELKAEVAVLEQSVGASNCACEAHRSNHGRPERGLVRHYLIGAWRWPGNHHICGICNRSDLEIDDLTYRNS